MSTKRDFVVFFAFECIDTVTWVVPSPLLSEVLCHLQVFMQKAD